MFSRRLLILLSAALLGLLVACAPGFEPTPIPRFEAPEDEIVREALVDEITIVPIDAPQPAYQLEIRGHFRDTCEEIGEIEQSIENDTISVTVHTVNPTDEICAQVLVPFEHAVPLEIEGLTPGTHTVEVNGVTTALELDRAARGEEIITRDALIDEIEIVTDVMPPASYGVEISGHFRDGCSILGEIEQVVERDVIRLMVYTSRPEDAICTQALVPFTHTIPLDFKGLDPGEYTIDVDGVTTPLELTKEDVAPSDKDSAKGRAEEIMVTRAPVDSFDLNIMESYPIQVSVTLYGEFPDGCSSLGDIEQIIQGRTIYLNVYMERDPAAFCTLALVPFRETVSLDISGLEPGTYTVNVNNLTQELVLD